MDINSILITNSGINKTTGGGVVGLNLMEALLSCSNLKLVLSNQHFKDSKIADMPAYCIEPNQYGYSDPFFMDYMAKLMIEEVDITSIELAQTYACPFGMTVEKLKKDYFCKIIADIAPHNTEFSQEEHMKFLGQYPFPHLTNEFLWKAYSKHLRFADKVIVHSHKSAEYLKEKAKLNEFPAVIPHGCYPPDKVPEYPEEIQPGSFGALGFDKGTPYLIEAWNSMQQSEKTLFLMGGHDINAFKSSFAPWLDKFQSVGHIKDVGDFYSSISFLVAPSVSEGFGICILEAMSWGRPVIVAEGAGASELVTDGKSGFVVKIRDSTALAEKIQWYYDNPDEIKTMGQHARETALKYTWDIIKKKYIDIYKGMF